MARARTKPSETAEQTQPPPSAEEQDRAAENAKGNEPESEVRAEEFSQGIQEPVNRSGFQPVVVAALKERLDPNRIRRRSGRGRSQFEYLAGHDDKRRMNEIFGFGGWSSKLVKIEELAPAVQIASDNNREGCHVGYMAVVEVSVCREDGTWVSYSDIGYGDGVEYGPAAFITARELAIKEASTDAFKRACVFLGDQFGLILYAKDDERKRIARDENAKAADEVASARLVRRDPRTEAPKTFAAITVAFNQALVDTWWLSESVQTHFGKPTADLSNTDKHVALQKLQTAYLELIDGEVARDELGTPTRAGIRRAFGVAFEGVEFEGPPWRLTRDEQDRPTKEEYEQQEAQRREAEAAEAEKIEFGAPDEAGKENVEQPAAV